MAQNQKSAEKPSADKTEDVTCDNSPDHEKARTYTADGAIAPIHLCDYCAPPKWLAEAKEAAGETEEDDKG